MRCPVVANAEHGEGFPILPTSRLSCLLARRQQWRVNCPSDTLSLEEVPLTIPSQTDRGSWFVLGRASRHVQCLWNSQLVWTFVQMPGVQLPSQSEAIELSAARLNCLWKIPLVLRSETHSQFVVQLLRHYTVGLEMWAWTFPGRRWN